MAITHKAVKEQKAKPIVKKEDNPQRKFMTKDEAVADSKRLKDETKALEDYKQKLREERNPKPTEGTPVYEDKQETALADDKAKEIARLEDKLAKEKGPGSNARKERLRAQIEELKK